MPTGTLWALCSSSASSLSSPPKPKPSPQGNPPHFPPNNREARPHVGPSLKSPCALTPHRHFIYNGVGAVKTNFSVHFFRSVFSSPIRIFFFLATKVRAVIVWRNSLSSTTHLFDPDSRRDHDYFFELPGFPGRQDAHSNERSQLRPRNDSACPAL